MKLDAKEIVFGNVPEAEGKRKMKTFTQETL